jgi:sugar lactone lactonase YvrE
MKPIYYYACFLFVALSILGVENSMGQCNVSIHSSSSCSLPKVLTVESDFPVARMEWKLNGGLVRVDSVKYPATAVTIAGNGSAGSASSQAGNPSAVFLDSLHNLYICEVYYNRISKWTPGSVSGTTIAGGNAAYPAVTLKDLFRPMGCVIDPALGYLYIADMTNNRVMRFNPGSAGGDNGVVVAGGNGAGAALNQLNTVVDVVLDASGNLYVADLENRRVLKFPPGSTSSTMGVVVAGGNGAGTALNQLQPHGIHIDRSGNLYVADVANARILKFPPGSTSSTMGTIVAGGNGPGAGLNQFARARDVYVDGLGYIYVADDNHGYVGTYNTNRILRFPPNSTSATQGVMLTNGLDYPTLHVSDSGHVFIPEYNKHRVLKLTASITDTFTATSAGTYSVTVYGFNGCVATETITINAGGGAPTFAVSTNPTVCVGATSTSLTLNSVANSPDQYSISWNAGAQSAGFTDLVNQSLSGSTINIVVPPGINASTYSGTVTLRNSSTGCASTAVNFSVLATINGPGFSVATNPVVCKGATSAVLNMNSVTGSPNRYTVIWDGAAQTAGFVNQLDQTLSGSAVTLTVPATAPPASYSGVLRLRNSASGCIGSDVSFSLLINPLPVVMVSPSGSMEVCAGQTVLLTASSGTGSSYEWKDGVSIIGTGSSYSAGTGGDYYVVVTDGNNCKDSSATVSIVQLSRPNVLVDQDDTSFCNGEYVRLEAVSTDTGLTYQWKDGNALLSATADFLEVSATGVYSVVVTRAQLAGCSDSSVPVMVTVHPLPAPSISWDGVDLTTDTHFTSYQWHIGGQPILGATNYRYTPDEPGTYSVVVVDSNGCSSGSSTYQVHQVNSITAIYVKDISIFPNPIRDMLHINSPLSVRVMLRGIDGKLIGTYEGSSLAIATGQLPDGVYLLEIATVNGQPIGLEKVIKQSW